MFGPILESSGNSLNSLGPPGSQVNDARASSWGDWLVMSLLVDDAFSRGMIRWMVYPTPCTSLWLTAAQRGVGPSCRTLDSLIMVMVTEVYRGKGSFLGRRHLTEDLSSSVLAYGILHIVNSFLPGGAYPLVMS
jgi:hypothetical protein